MFSFGIPPLNPFASLAEDQHIKLIRDIPNFQTLPARLSEKLLPITKQRIPAGTKIDQFDEICFVLKMVKSIDLTDVVKFREDHSSRILYCRTLFTSTSIETISISDRELYLFELCTDAIESLCKKYATLPNAL